LLLSKHLEDRLFFLGGKRLAAIHGSDVAAETALKHPFRVAGSRDSVAEPVIVAFSTNDYTCVIAPCLVGGVQVRRGIEESPEDLDARFWLVAAAPLRRRIGRLRRFLVHIPGLYLMFARFLCRKFRSRTVSSELSDVCVTSSETLLLNPAQRVEFPRRISVELSHGGPGGRPWSVTLPLEINSNHVTLMSVLEDGLRRSRPTLWALPGYRNRLVYLCLDRLRSTIKIRESLYNSQTAYYSHNIHTDHVVAPEQHDKEDRRVPT